MKFKWLFLTLLLSTIFAQEMELLNGEVFDKCDEDKRVGELRCTKGDRIVLLRHGGGGAYALEYSKKSKKTLIHEVSYATDSSNVMLYALDPRSMQAVDVQSRVIADGELGEISRNQRIISNLDYNFDEERDSKFAQDFDEIVSIAKKRVEDLQKKVKKESLNLDVDGKLVECKKPANEMCKFLTCEDSKTKEKYYPYFDFDAMEDFIVLPDAGNSKESRNKKLTSLKFKSGETIIGDDTSNLMKKFKAMVPTKYLNNPKLFLAGIGGNDSLNALSPILHNCTEIPQNLLANLQKEINKDQEQADMVKFVDYVGNAIDAIMINRESLPANACLYNGSYYTKESFAKVKPYMPKAAKSVSLKKATELFNKAKARKDIAWNYKMDGCYARAHLMARMFEKEGVVVEKAWARGNLRIPNMGGLAWGYHVAPVLEVEQNGKIEKMIIDPSVASKPIKVEEWMAIMKATAADTKRTDYPSALNASMYKKNSLSFSSSDVYWPNLTEIQEEDKMKMARETMDEYLQY